MGADNAVASTLSGAAAHSTGAANGAVARGAVAGRSLKCSLPPARHSREETMFNDLDYIRLTRTPSRATLIMSAAKLLFIGAAIAGWNIA
jgi:hypothetical protein